MRSTVKTRSSWALLLAVVCALCAWMAAGASEARAATTCDGTLHGRIAGPLRVPAGQSCKLAPGTVVAGKTSVFGGSLTAHDATFAGDVFATDALAITLDHSSIARSLDLASGHGPIDLRDDTIIGLTNLLDNAGPIDIFGGRLGALRCSVNLSTPRFHGVRGARAARARCVHASVNPAPPSPTPAPAAPQPTSPLPPPTGLPCQLTGPGIMHPDSSQICLPSGPVSQ